MDKRKKEKLAKKGWKVGSVAEFLDLSAEESAYIEMKLALSKNFEGRDDARNSLRLSWPKQLSQANPGSRRWKQATPLYQSIYL